MTRSGARGDPRLREREVDPPCRPREAVAGSAAPAGGAQRGERLPRAPWVRMNSPPDRCLQGSDEALCPGAPAAAGSCSRGPEVPCRPVPGLLRLPPPPGSLQLRDGVEGLVTRAGRPPLPVLVALRPGVAGAELRSLTGCPVGWVTVPALASSLHSCDHVPLWEGRGGSDAGPPSAAPSSRPSRRRSRAKRTWGHQVRLRWPWPLYQQHVWGR